MPGKIADLNVRLGLDLTPFIREIKRVESRLNKFGRKLEGIGRDLSQKVTLPLVGLGGAAVKAFADFDKLQKGLEAVNDSSQDAAQQFDRLRKLAESPGLGLEQAVQGAIRLQAIGLSAQDAENTLLQLSKAVALTGTADNLDSVVTQLAQITSKGKILQEDLGVILENAPALAGAFQDAFGTTNAEDIRKQVGNVTEFRQRLLDSIATSETFSKVQGSLSNSFNNLGNTVKFSLAQIGQTIAETINLQAVIDKLSKFISDLAERFKNLSPQAQKTILIIAGIAAAIGPVLLAIGGFTTLLGTLASGLSILLSPVTAVIAGIAALTAGIVIAYNRSEQFRNIVNATGKALAIFGQLVANRFKAVGGLLKEVFGLIGDVLRLIVDGFKNAFGRLGTLLSKAFSNVKSFFGLFGDLGNVTFKGFVSTVEGVFGGLINIIREFVKIVRESISAFVDGFEKLGNRDFKGAFQSFKEAFSKNNPIGIAFTQGERLANAYSDGFNKAFAATQYEFRKGQNSAVPDFVATDFSTDLGSSPVTPGQNDGTRKINKAGGASPLQGIAGAGPLGAIQDGFAERIAATTEEVKKLSEALPQVQERFTGLQEVALTAFDTFVNGFDQVLTSAEGFGRGMIKVLGKVAQAAIQAAVSQVILKRLQALGGFLGLAAVPLAAGAGKIAASLFGKLISSIGVPFAKGGIVTGPTNALIGEAGPEAVIPLSPEKLRKYFPQQGGGPVQIFLNDIMIAEAVERGQTKLSRIR